MPSSQTTYGCLTEWDTEVMVRIAWGAVRRGDHGAAGGAELMIGAQVSRVLAKPGLRGRAQAVVFAYEARLVRPNGR